MGADESTPLTQYPPDSVEWQNRWAELENAIALLESQNESLQEKVLDLQGALQEKVQDASKADDDDELLRQKIELQQQVDRLLGEEVRKEEKIARLHLNRNQVVDWLHKDDTARAAAPMAVAQCLQNAEVAANEYNINLEEEDVERAIIAEKEQDDVYENTVNSVATAAKALANSLSTEAVNADGLTERRAQLCSKSDAMKERLSELTPDVDRLSQEITAAEEVQRELVQQMKQNKEHLESLRRQRDDCRKEEEHLRHSLQRTEQKLATQLATEDAARQRCEVSEVPCRGRQMQREKVRSRGDSPATRREQAMHDERVEKHKEMVFDAKRMRKGLKNRALALRIFEWLKWATTEDVQANLKDEFDNLQSHFFVLLEAYNKVGTEEPPLVVPGWTHSSAVDSGSSAAPPSPLEMPVPTEMPTNPIMSDLGLDETVSTEEPPVVPGLQSSSSLGPGSSAAAGSPSEMPVPTEMPTSPASDSDLEDAMAKTLAQDPRLCYSAVGAVTGAAVLGAGGAATGLTTGSILGAAVGVIPAVFTFGLSIPFCAAVGGGAGLVVGAASGATAGALAGGATGNCIRDE